MGLKRISPPASLPFTLAEVKQHLRKDSDEDDAKIEMFMQAAVDHAEGPEGFLGRALIDQTWDLYLDAFPTNEIKIPLPPLIEIVGVFHLDSSGVEQEVSSDNYIVDDASQPGWVVLASSASWPTPLDGANAIRVRFRAGYLSSDSPPVADVPADIKAGLLLYIGALYEHREDVVVGQTVAKLSWGADALLRPRRKHLNMA